MKNIKYLVLSALFLALGIILPFFTGQIPEIGSMLLPMHLPVLLCGFVCGWPYGLAIGFITPLLRSLLFSMPPMFPKAVAMAFELAAYGSLAGLFYHLLPHKNTARIYLSLIGAMLGGRIVYGLVCIPLMGIAKVPYSFEIFFASTVIEALPGIILQLILIPILLLALQKANLIETGAKGNYHE
ncbi:MAG: ECF transporter S component [Lachnospiraceae bacterium]|nr:ECF transporter S component [Lachnospiraceae bacterium]